MNFIKRYGRCVYAKIVSELNTGLSDDSPWLGSGQTN
jgi:hypothetical protein